MDPILESYFCQAVEHNFCKALNTILAKVKDPSSVVTRDYTIKVSIVCSLIKHPIVVERPGFIYITVLYLNMYVFSTVNSSG